MSKNSLYLMNLYNRAIIASVLIWRYLFANSTSINNVATYYLHTIFRGWLRI